MAKAEDIEYSQAVSFDVKKVFVDLLGVVSIQETTLAANQWLHQAERLQFKGNSVEPMKPQTKSAERFEITLKPLEIRTFLMKLRNDIYGPGPK